MPTVWSNPFFLLIPLDKNGELNNLTEEEAQKIFDEIEDDEWVEIEDVQPRPPILGEMKGPIEE